MRRSGRQPPRRVPRGAVNPIGVLLTVAFVGALYWAATFGPYYLDNLNVKEAAEVGLSAADSGPEAMVQRALQRINYGNLGNSPVGTHMEETDQGDFVEKPGLGLTEENVIAEVDEKTRTARVTIDYARTVRLKPTQSVRTIRFHVVKEGRF
ncbi:MAG: hypothetical protein JNK82_25565 [Myxococcaceae bacterium]|nr:hypothetical protein [Myxococcaceae bacterium]